MPTTYFTKSKYLPPLIIFILTAYQLVRIVVFVNVYGGIEHDGGWALTVSRSLAEWGTYTTTVSTIVDPQTPGGMNIHQKFDAQTPDGRIWFRASSVTGPASIVPDAIALIIFGTGFRGMVAGPLIFYTLFLLLAAVILYQLAGLWAVVLFHLFIYFYPHLSIFLSYQALGEVPSMVYILTAYLAFMWATQQKQRRWRHFFIAGLVVGLAINAKLITTWSISGIAVWAGFLWLRAYVVKVLPKVFPQKPNKARPSAQKNLRFNEILLLGSGTALVLLIWEFVQWAVLVRVANFDMYRSYIQTRLGEVLDQGSGVRLRIHSGTEFFWDKFFRLEEIAHPQRWATALIFVCILGGGLALIWLWRHQYRKQNLLAPIWIGWLVNTYWFVSMAKTGWPRHFWFGLVLAVLLLCTISIAFVQLGRRQAARSKNMSLLVIGTVMLIFIGWGFVKQPHVWGVFINEDLIPYWQERQINDKYGAYLPWIIISRADQDEIVAYLDRLPPEANVYYPFQHKAAEISALTGRIFYPLDRRELMNAHPQDVAIIGPSLIAPWMEPGRRAVLRQMVAEECPQPIIANDYYMICPFPPE